MNRINQTILPNHLFTNQKAVINQQFKFEYETRKTIDDAENEKVLAVEKEKQKKQFIILIIIIPTSCFVLISNL